MTQPRDVNLDEWLVGVGFHPADTELKQLGHEAVRQLIADTGVRLHKILPPGRDKSLTFKALEDVLMRANRALAVAGGPDSQRVTAGSLRGMIGPPFGDAVLPQDHRKAEQRGEPA